MEIFIIGDAVVVRLSLHILERLHNFNENLFKVFMTLIPKYLRI